MSQSSASLVEQFQEGRYLSHIGEFDAANAILLGCVVTEPGDSDFVDGFLVNLARKCPFGGTLPVGQLPSRIATAMAARNWVAVLCDGPCELVSNPWNVPLILALADAAAGSGWYEAELRYLQAAIEVAPQAVEVHRRAGRSWARLRRYEEALAAWKQVELLDPEDPDAARMLGLLVIARSRQRAGLPSDQAELLGDEFEQPVRLSRPAKPRSLLRMGEGRRPRELSLSASEIQRTPIQQLEAATREYPTDPVLYLQLAPMYLEKGRDYDAERLLTKGLTETENEPRVRELWEDVTMLRLGKKIQQAQLRMDVESSDESRTDYSELCAKRDRMEIEFFTARLKREPENTALAFELGKRLRQAGRTREAIQCFERAIKDDAYRCAAAYELAECSLHVRDLSVGFRYCRMAIDAAHLPSDVEPKKRALFRAAELAAKIRLPVLARSYLAPLLQMDAEHQAGQALARELA